MKALNPFNYKGAPGVQGPPGPEGGRGAPVSLTFKRTFEKS